MNLAERRQVSVVMHNHDTEQWRTLRLGPEHLGCTWTSRKSHPAVGTEPAVQSPT
ncbi:hypothetical protein SAMN04489726_1299 [Allokutzneria albata]|uniref:Uncharacterized protein n=1 Tax=Allokutzneria albata TaxID=211114 RepID=A0A1G9SPF4_ALLAB|nr:hypothetical protein SAMN04489726_1299 [Allokutzneria albata]